MLNHHGGHLTTRLRKYQTEIFPDLRKTSDPSGAHACYFERSRETS